MKDFITYEQALELKQIGFDEPCFGHYWEKLFYSQTTHHHPATMPNSPESCLAPTFSQAFRWFREKYQLFSWVKVEYEYGGTSYGLHITGVRQSDIANGPFTTYEEAELACLNKLIEIVKTK